MADLPAFDPNSKPIDQFDPVPGGKWPAMIIESDVVETREKTGDMLKLKWQIIDGPHVGRFVFDRINIRNNSAKAQEIGQRQLDDMRRAVGVFSGPREALHNKPCIINVKVRPAGPDKNGVHREAQNEVKGYEPIAKQYAAPPQQLQTTAPEYTPPITPSSPAAVTGAGAVKEPWRR